MNVKQLTALMEGIAPAIRRFVQESTGPLAARVKALEDRAGIAPPAAPAAVESHKSFGITPYAPGAVYPKGAAVTHAGAIWTAAYTTRRPPGDGDAWTRLGTQEVAQ